MKNPKPKPYAVAPNPCASCPYRRDTPPGIWAASEYEKLPGYDEGSGELPLSVFLCHLSAISNRDTVCRGWLTVAADSVAVRIALAQERITPGQVDAPVSVPLYASGAEACSMGRAGVKKPTRAARTASARLLARGPFVVESNRKRKIK